MEVLEKIKINFNKGYFDKAMRIDGLPEDYPAWTLKRQDWYGVAVKMDQRLVFSERFSSARIWTSNDALLEEQAVNLLLLTCTDVELRNEFAVICAQFVQTDEYGTARKELISDPAAWWSNWKSLIGNSQSEHEVYSKIGELTVIECLLRTGNHPKWSGIESATHDVEVDDRSYEIKSTVRRYGYEVEISSIYQMKKEGESLNLVFIRFERSLLGRSLDDLVESIVAMGYSRQKIEVSLEKAGLERGCTARSVHYKVLEMRVFPVDDNFPALTLDSFVGGQLPPHVTRVKYTVDLSGVPSKATL